MIYTIYKISIAGEDYIGSTRDLKQRKKSHKSITINDKDARHNLKLYATIRANGGWDCCEITPVEMFECETKQQACIREEHWRREYKALLNSKKAFRTREEGIKYHKENNGTKNVCECGGEYTNGHKARHFKSKLHQEFIQSATSFE